MADLAVKLQGYITEALEAQELEKAKVLTEMLVTLQTTTGTTVKTAARTPLSKQRGVERLQGFVGAVQR